MSVTLLHDYCFVPPGPALRKLGFDLRQRHGIAPSPDSEMRAYRYDASKATVGDILIAQSSDGRRSYYEVVPIETDGHDDMFNEIGQDVPSWGGPFV